jgi:hypothetical protein
MAESLSRHWSWRRLLAGLVLGVIASGCAPTKSGAPTPRSFDGDSSALTQTVIVPTLDTPIPQGKSAIWCSSFQLAWNRLKEDVAKGPVLVQNAETVADRLNRAQASEADLDPSAFYAAAGFVEDGIFETIVRDMAEKFPNVPAPRPVEGVGLLMAYAYAYLQAGVNYRFPYFDNPNEFVFTDSAGSGASVQSFGTPTRSADFGLDTFRGQAEVLFAAKIFHEVQRQDFALDLSRFSEPNQLVLAAVSRKPTLAEAIANVEGKRSQYQPANREDRRLGHADILFVPVMCWQIAHRFRELEGSDKVLLNPSLRREYIVGAEQIVDFRMDRNGAAVTSKATIAIGGVGRLFLFDRPFLVLLSKRGARQPFFVMWVDNTELLQKR